MKQQASHPNSKLRDEFDDISDLLYVASRRMGAYSYSFEIGEASYPPEVFLLECGTLTTILVAHTEVMLKFAGMASPDLNCNAAPFTVVPDETTPTGLMVYIQDSDIPLAVGVQFLQTALEHCICLGIHALGHTPQSWDKLPNDRKSIPIEPYYRDLENRWMKQEILNDPIKRLTQRPQLIDRNNFHLLGKAPAMAAPMPAATQTFTRYDMR